MTARAKSDTSAIQSAFLKANTLKHLLVVDPEEALARRIPRGQVLKIEIEVDTDPPPGFDTETRFLLRPIPFRSGLLASRHVRWQDARGALPGMEGPREGQDWYDLFWFAANHPQLHLGHLEQQDDPGRHLKKTHHLDAEWVLRLPQRLLNVWM